MFALSLFRNKPYRLGLIPLLVIIGLVFFVSGCRKKQAEPANDWSLINKNLPKYRAFVGSSTPQEESSPELDYYQDFTWGLKVAFQDTNTKAFFDTIISSLKMSSINLFQISNETIKPFGLVNKDRIFDQVRNPDNFKQAYAPLDKALEKIVHNQRPALYITDGELWDRSVGESERPWAREHLAEWLKGGNKVLFYVTDHPDAGKIKHLFYVLFIPRNLNGLSSNFVGDIAYALANDVGAKGLKYATFSFDNSAIGFEQRYATEKSGGADSNLDLQPNYLNPPGENWEFLELGLGWKNIVRYVGQAVDDQSGKPVPGGNHLLRKLFAKAQNQGFHDIRNIDVKVTDITEDYSKFAIWQSCLETPPTFKLDDKGRKQKDPNSGQFIIITPGLDGCYSDNGELLPQYRYEHKVLPEKKEVFTLDRNLFQNTWQQDHQAEVGIKLHPNFNGTQISSDRENLLQVDLYVTEATPLAKRLELEKFIWGGKQISRNRAMYQSMLMAINDANPQGQVVYTYYLKTMPNDYHP